VAKNKKMKKAVKKTVSKKAASAPAARKQTGHTRIAAGFTANDAAATIKWYTDVLGFKVLERWERDGEFRGASLGSGDIVINIGQDDWKMGRDRQKGQGVRLYITTNTNIDDYAAAIKARGGQLDQEPMDGWGTRSLGISDPDGYKLTFMSPRS
jgi:predicted enzyme related to lactoylglutathione lyase